MDKLDKLPELDYLSKDYAGFRQLIFDQLSVLVPDWAEQHPADIGNAVIEVLAYAADYLSYYQDAIATEAYLGTARLRRSIQQHVRLLDYDWHEGCNARVWVQVHVQEGGGPVVLEAKTPLFTHLEKDWLVPAISRDVYRTVLAQQPVVFETMHTATLYEAHNKIDFYSEEPNRHLPQGATRAQLCDPERQLKLQPGDVLIFEEKLDPVTGLASKADPTHRQAVRLTQVTHGGENILQIEWSAADALTFPLELSTPYGGSQPVSVALGNIVLADHGQTILQDEELPAVPAVGRYYPPLRQKGLTFQVAYDHERDMTMSAKDTLTQAPRKALPAITMIELGPMPINVAPDLEQQLLIDTYYEDNPEFMAHFNSDYKGKTYLFKRWALRSELLSSGTFSRDYAVETEEDGRAHLRFGYGLVGWQPAVGGAHWLARYRIGNGTIGNIGPEALAHIVKDNQRLSVRNPMAAQGGTDPSNRESARLHAPYAFQKPERCVAEEDYMVVAKRHPEVADAVAQRDWMDSRNTTVIYVRRRDDLAVDTVFQRELRAWLEPFRVAGSGIEIREAHFVPLNIELRMTVKPGHRSESVRNSITQTFNNGLQPDGSDGFFNPKCFTFGKALYPSQVISQAMQVPGVASVDVVRFRRMDSAVDVGYIPIGPYEIIRLDHEPALEIIRLDHDPTQPARVQIVFRTGDL
jgi:hypothetical protein